MAIIEIHLKNDKLYKVEGQDAIVYVHDHDINKITTMKLIRNNYMTYDWLKARKSPVFLDWIKISDKEDYLPEPIKEEIKKAKKEEKKMKERDPETQKKPVKKGKK